MAGSLIAARLLAAQLFEVGPGDAARMIAGVIGTVIVAAMVAAVPPGRRAAAADPLVSMRVE
jgi:uncharacterized membrane protein YeaQ/YmgE (transglycosylase-associated protein family)